MFVRAFASLDGFRGESAGTWLHSIAVSLSLNEIRRRKREWAHAPLEDATALVESAPRSDPILREKIMEAVNDLPEDLERVPDA